MITEKEVSTAQGASNTKPIDLPKMREFLKKDLQKCILLLDAVYKDPATMDALADFLYGRYENARLQEDIKNQTKLEL